MSKRLIAIFLINGFILNNVAAIEDNSVSRALQSVPQFNIESKDTSAEDKLLHDKFSGDKEKVDKAITNTKTLISQSRGRPYLPELYLRLAELYIEKSRIVYFLRKIEHGDPEGSAVKGLESNALKGKALETYQRIVTDFPDFIDIDKVHFYMAHEFRELNLFDKMVAQYQVIIKNYQSSSFVAEAHLLLGDYYFSLPDLILSKKHYEAVLRYPKSSAINIARYKLAWVNINNNDFAKAIPLLEQSVKSPEESLNVDTYNRVDIRLEALNDLTFSYSKHYTDKSPQEALDYFTQYAWSRAVYTQVLEKLAYRYLIQKKWSHAAYIYRSLAKLQTDSKKLLQYIDHILTCVREMNNFEQADKDIALIIKTLDSIRYSVHVPEDEKAKAMLEYELYSRDISTRLHETSRSTKKMADYKKAADAYDQYLTFFDNSPKYTEMQQNYAETLFLAGQYAKSGKIYEKIAEKYNGVEKQKHLYSATFAYYSALKDRTKLNYYEIAQATSGLEVTGDLYAKLFPKSPQVANIKFNIAWVAYDEGHYLQAIEEFDAYIQQYPKGKEAELAVDLILASYNQLEDNEGLVKYAKSLQSYANLSSKIKSHVSQVAATSEAKIITDMAVVSVNDWDKGKADLLSYADTNKASSLGEKALNALFVAAKEKAELTTMQDAGYKLIKQYPDSIQGESILKVLIDASLKTAQFRTLVEYLEVYAKQYPNNPDSYEFLMQAAEIRQSLMQYSQANKNYSQLLRLKNTDSKTKREIILTSADNYQRQGQVTKAISFLEGNRKNYNRKGKLTVDAKLANLYFEQNNMSQFKRPFNAVNKAFKSTVPEEVGLQADVAKMYFNFADDGYENYISTQLQGEINDDIVASKQAQFQQLSEQYYAVLEYQQPRWSITSLYRLSQINQEFANFLSNAPLPALEPEQVEEYKQIIAENVLTYNDEAEQLLIAGNQLVLKVKILEPEINRFVNPNNSNANQFEFSPKGVEIGVEAFKQDTLSPLHKTLYQHPKDSDQQLKLAVSYYQLRDYSQTLIIANHLLNNDSNFEQQEKATLYNLIGKTYLALGKDTLAKESFQQALSINSDFTSAIINLAALYQFYGHVEDAKALLDGVALTGAAEPGEHRRARQVLGL